MISEFICLKEFQKSECKSTYICSLPDSDLDSDFGMVICGYINIRESFFMMTVMNKES